MIRKIFQVLALFLMLAGANSASAATLEGLYPQTVALHAADILDRAYQAAGGASWRRPESLFMEGYAVFFSGYEATTYDRYEMSRVYPIKKEDAHRADGKVRIEAWAGESRAFVMAYDGQRTYDANGPIDDQSANDRWSANFGFGAIRHGLDEGWNQKRLADDLIDGRLAYIVELTDPSGGITRFGIAQDDYAIVYVGFDTDRGWHERRYSEFFSKPGVGWVQPGRVRLYYDGVKQNEVLWTDFRLDKEFADDHFVIE